MLLGVQWKGQVYVHSALPFGSTKDIQCSRRQPIMSIPKEGIVHTIYYLDDFLFIGTPGSP